MISQPPSTSHHPLAQLFLTLSMFLPPPRRRYAALPILVVFLLLWSPTTANAQEGGVITISNTKPESGVVALCSSATLTGMEGVPVYKRTNGVFEYDATWTVGTPVRVLRVVETPDAVYWEVQRKDLGWKAWVDRLVVYCSNQQSPLVESAAICAGTISAPSKNCNSTFAGVAEAFWLNLTFVNIQEGDKIELKMYDPTETLIRRETIRWRGTGLRLQNRSFLAEDMTVAGRYMVHVWVNGQFAGNVPVTIQP